MSKESYSSFRGLFLLNVNDCRNFSQYRSVEAMRSELREHRSNHPLKIHPRSRFRTAWELFYFGYVVLNVFNFSFYHILARYTTFSFPTDFHIIIADAPPIINIFINFMTGYYKMGSRTAILETSKICDRYVKTFFFIDLFGLVFGSPLIVLLYETDWYQENKYFNHFLGLYFIVCLGVGARYISALYYWKRSLAKYFMLNNLLASVVEFFSTFLISVFVLTNLAYAANNDYILARNFSNNESSTMENFQPDVGTNKSVPIDVSVFKDEELKTDIQNSKPLKSYISLIGRIYLGKEVMNDKESAIHVGMDMIFIIYPYTRYLVVITFLIIVLWGQRGSRGKYNEVMDNLDEYLQRIKISQRLKLRLGKFYEEIFGGRYFEEATILESVSCEIREEIMAIKVSGLRQQIKLFSLIPLNELMAVARYLVMEVYFGNDVVILSGTVLDRIYFLAKGTVAIYNDDEELCHIPSSNHFGLEGISEDYVPASLNFLACETIIAYTLSRTGYRSLEEQCPVFCELVSYTNDFFNSFFTEILDRSERE